MFEKAYALYTDHTLGKLMNRYKQAQIYMYSGPNIYLDT